MTKLVIVRRWGSHKPGETVDVQDEQQTNWLLFNHFAERSNQLEAATAGAAAPGTDGPDPLAGGDYTRRRPNTRKAEYGPNRALPIPGAPVQYNMGIAMDSAGEGSQEVPEADEPAKPSSRVSGSGRRKATSS